MNLIDFNKLAANLGLAPPRRWWHGNFDFDDDVDLVDFNKLAANMGATGLAPDSVTAPFNRSDLRRDLLPSLEELML